MIYRFLADLVVAVHVGFVLFVILGGLLALHRRWVAVLHLPAAAWGALIEFRGWVCPLTPLENHLRQRGGEAGYGGGFIEHYLLPLLYPPGLNRQIQLLLGSAVICLNLVVYWFVLRRMGLRVRGRASSASARA